MQSFIFFGLNAIKIILIAKKGLIAKLQTFGSIGDIKAKSVPNNALKATFHLTTFCFANLAVARSMRELITILSIKTYST